MKTSEVLNKAADLIEKRGWDGLGEGGTLGGDSWGRDGSSLCLEGGIMAATGETDFLQAQRNCPAYAAVQRYLDLNRSQHLWGWNDSKSRTKEEVIEVLRAAALIEEAKENQSLLVTEKVSA